MFCWTNVFVVRPASAGIISIIFGEFFDKLVSGNTENGQYYGAVCLVFVACLNIVSVKGSVYLQKGMMWLKLTALATIIISGCIKLADKGESPSSRTQLVRMNLQAPCSAWRSKGVCLHTTDGKISTSWSKN